METRIKELNRRGAVALAGALVTGAFAMRNGVLCAAAAEDKGGEDVSATEDLMREHGVIRRVLSIYAELARRLETQSGTFDPAVLTGTAKLIRDFGEDYHERLLEDQYIFPDVRKTGGANEALVNILLAQHQRGRAITDYIREIGSRGKIGGDAKPLASALTSFVRMYNAHAAWEDTVVFPAWKALQSKAKLEELADKFEDIEHEKLGKDGFENAVARVASVEQALGLGDLSVFTAPPPPAT
jgi:hemerythrin-like domain-containing protein